MYSLYCVMPDKLESIENYESIEVAVQETVGMWMEHDGDPRTMVLHDSDDRPAVTFAPVGVNAVMVVYKNGFWQYCSEIEYETHEDYEKWITHYVRADSDGYVQKHRYNHSKY
jgi:hypothetical protein